MSTRKSRESSFEGKSNLSSLLSFSFTFFSISNSSHFLIRLTFPLFSSFTPLPYSAHTSFPLYINLYLAFISLTLWILLFLSHTPYFIRLIFYNIYYLCSHHCISFSRRALTISHQTSIVSRKQWIENWFSESFIDFGLCCIIFWIRIGRIKTIIEAICFRSFPAVTGFPRWDFQIRQCYFVGLCLDD